MLCVGQSFLTLGLQALLKSQTNPHKRDGKLMHAPLAATAILDANIIDLWAEVGMQQDSVGSWGAVSRQRFAHIHKRHSAELFRGTFLDERSMYIRRVDCGGTTHGIM